MARPRMRLLWLGKASSVILTLAILGMVGSVLFVFFTSFAST
jgi:hypothetical protein